MNRNRRIAEFHDEHCCAASVNGNFRRSSSLRLRGEKMVQRSPLSTRKLIPIITENNYQKQRSDVPRLLEPGHRQRSHVSATLCWCISLFIQWIAMATWVEICQQHTLKWNRTSLYKAKSQVSMKTVAVHLNIILYSNKRPWTIGHTICHIWNANYYEITDLMISSGS